MKIKTGDNVKVLSGKSRGKTGKVIQVLTHGAYGQTMVVVEGANMRKKHLKPSKKGEKGQVLELAAPLHSSNVMLIDPKSNQPTRVGYRMDGNEKKRVAKRSNEFID